MKLFSEQLIFCTIFWVCVLTNGDNSFFQNDTIYYEEATARILADFAAVSYCKNADQWDCDICEEYPGVNATFLNDYMLSAMIAFEPSLNKIIVAFRGTDPLSLVDWLDDFEARSVPYDLCENCFVHHGFYKAYREIYDDIDKNLNQYHKMYPDAPLAATGHSLGAALAVLFAINISVKSPSGLGDNRLILYTFGQPRIGNAEFADFISSTLTNRCFRITHSKDPVPHVPFQLMQTNERADFHLLESTTNYSPSEKNAMKKYKYLKSKLKYSLYQHNLVEIFYPQRRKFEKFKICSGGEDPLCSGQYSFDLLYIAHHWHYMDANFFDTTFFC
mmetsp:Transcript_25603/g.33508  ORF Transcript_25603/g.33508 Transcript_25603/m.33508 type:complete len:332 (+) Transcript_25603:124-1119(+)